MTPIETARLARSDLGLASAMRVSVLRLSRRLRHERPADGLTPTHLAVLGTLMRNGPLPVGELAAAEKVQPPSMTRTVNHLDEAGLVRREPHLRDRRQVVVTLTDHGNEVVLESRRRKEEWLNRVLADLTPDERRILRAAAPLLERLSRA